VSAIHFCAPFAFPRTEPQASRPLIASCTHNMPGPFDDAIAQALADLGVEDEGRDA
jgi:hypothetical protein